MNQQKISFEDWQRVEKGNSKTRLFISAYFNGEEKKEIERLINNSQSVRDIWLYFKDCDRMPFTYMSFVNWCRKNFKITNKEKTLYSKNKSQLGAQPVASDHSDGFKINLPIGDEKTDSPSQAPKCEVWKSSYKDLNDDEFKEFMKQKSKKLDQQSAEGESGVFRMNLPVEGISLGKNGKLPAEMLNPYKGLTDDEFMAVLKEKSDALKKQDEERLFNFNKSEQTI